MSKTVRIPKSKNMLFKKLSFLYLVFILFLFLTSPGEYVFPFQGMVSTQTALNEQFKAEFEAHQPETDQAISAKATTASYLESIREVENEFKAFSGNGLADFRLKEKDFSGSQVQFGPLGEKLAEANQNLADFYAKEYAVDLFPVLIQLEGFNLDRHAAVNYYFHETPNGIVPSILKHFKTVAYQTYLGVVKHSEQKQESTIEEIQNSPFIARFKESLIFGETFSMDVHNDTSKVKASINGVEVATVEKSPGIQQIIYTPKSPGDYALEVHIGKETILGSFHVDEPSLIRLGLTNRMNQLEVNKTSSLPWPNGYSNMGLRLVGTGCSLQTNGRVVDVTPYQEGYVLLSLLRDEDTLDQAQFYARSPLPLPVQLIGENGKASNNAGNALKIEPLDRDWEIIEFQAVVVAPSGFQASVQSANKHLPNELKLALSQAEDGANLLVRKIRLINALGEIRNGHPFILTKN